MCLYPKIIKNRKYVANKKNGGNVPKAKDKRTLYVAVGCQKCMECKKAKANNWRVRLLEEIKTRHDGKFITFTFSEESLSELRNEVRENAKRVDRIYDENNAIDGYLLDNEVASLAVRRFLERWRKHHKKSVRHWLVTELGQTSTERIHLHGLLFTDESIETITKRWLYGFTFIGDYVNEETVNYMVKYVHKVDEVHKEYNSRIFCSSGIGKGYIDRHAKRIHDGTLERDIYRAPDGSINALPIYYRNKLYSDEAREKLWIDRLNEKVRYVNGVKISVEKSDDNYFKALKVAREINTTLGYGNDSINYDEKKYQSQLRVLNKQNKTNNNGRNK